MNKSGGKTLLALLAIGAVIFGLVYGVIALTTNTGDDSAVISEESAVKNLNSFYNKMKINTPLPVKGHVSEQDFDSSTQKEELPEIDVKYPPVVEKNTELFVEIYTSPEKGESGTDGWLKEAAEAFNKSAATVNGKPVSVRLRTVSSGVAVDYIVSGKAVPDAFTPSNVLWGEMLKAEKISVSLIEKRMTGNVAGVLFSNETQERLIEKYGSIDLKSIAAAVSAGEISMGYTNPFASSTGLNYLLCTLMAFDEKNPLSSEAVKAFSDFSVNVPFVAFNTLQMRNAAASGSLDGFVMEYQSYANMPDLQSQYNFTPFGVRHDSPLYSIGKISSEKKQILEQFNEFCQQNKWQNLATEYGFNQLDDYKFEKNEPKGSVIVSAQKIWKENKNSGQPITAVFVADLSGSMEGLPLTNLKKSLISGAKYISKENYIGLVTFSNEVNIALPIAKFDLTQRSYLVGTAEGMRAGGGTAMYDGIVVGMKMLLDAKEKNPDTKLMLFVLTDGASNVGLDFGKTKGMLEGLKIPIYTIGYNADLTVLQDISNLNEAASINADSDDVIYQLGSLFNAQM